MEKIKIYVNTHKVLHIVDEAGEDLIIPLHVEGFQSLDLVFKEIDINITPEELTVCIWHPVHAIIDGTDQSCKRIKLEGGSTESITVILGGDRRIATDRRTNV